MSNQQEFHKNLCKEANYEKSLHERVEKASQKLKEVHDPIHGLVQFIDLKITLNEEVYGNKFIEYNKLTPRIDYCLFKEITEAVERSIERATKLIVTNLDKF